MSNARLQAHRERTECPGKIEYLTAEQKAALPKDFKCAECDGNLVLRDSKYGIFWGCSNWPNCDGKIGAHQATGQPLGTPVPKEVREKRIAAHEAFDWLWQQGPFTRKNAYAWLRQQSLPKDARQHAQDVKETPGIHIGELGVEGCEWVIKVCNHYKEKWLAKLRRKPTSVYAQSKEAS